MYLLHKLATNANYGKKKKTAFVMHYISPPLRVIQRFLKVTESLGSPCK